MLYTQQQSSMLVPSPIQPLPLGSSLSGVHEKREKCKLHKKHISLSVITPY